MRHRNKKQHNVRKAVIKGIFKVLLSNPPLLIIILVIIIGLVAYTIYTVDYQLKQIMIMYQSLSARVTDSKSGFDKRLFYVTTDENGNTKIVVGYRSEEEEEQAKQDAEQAGIDTGGTYDFSATDEEMIALFKEIGATDAKAYGLLACYNAATDCGMTPKQTLGLLACAMIEGYPGLVQYGYPKDLGSTGLLHSSSSSNPLIIDTPQKREALKTVQYSGGDLGIGTAQWTNGRADVYIDLMKDTYGSQAILSNDDLYLLDYTMYKNELTGGYKSLINNIGDHDATLESILVYSWAKYEAGFNNYIDDNISSYSGRKLDQLNDRYSNIQLLDAKFTERYGNS